MKAKNIFELLGQKTINFFTTIYEIWLLVVNTFKCLPSIWFYRRQVIEQLYIFSFRTLPLTSVIAVFVGLVSMIQGVYQSTPFVPRAYTINVIFKSTVMELCPVTLSLVLAGKLGASLAAEIASMKISEQIEALETMSLDPTGFLVLPRFIAALIMLPVMSILANFVAVFSMFFASSIVSNWISAQEFLRGLQIDFRVFELYFGSLIKPAVYGSLIALIGSYFGLKTVGGARGVGEASTKAVVVSAILILVFDYYLGRLLL